MESIIIDTESAWKPEQKLEGKSADQLPLYGMNQYWQVFTPRQLVALTTFSDIIQETREEVKQDALDIGLHNDGITLGSVLKNVAFINM
jgi:putative DNA methylase